MCAPKLDRSDSTSLASKIYMPGRCIHVTYIHTHTHRNVYTHAYTHTCTHVHTHIQAGKAEAGLPSEIPAVQRARPEYLSSYDTDVVLSEKIGFERSFVCVCVCVCVCVSLLKGVLW